MASPGSGAAHSAFSFDIRSLNVDPMETSGPGLQASVLGDSMDRLVFMATVSLITAKKLLPPNYMGGFPAPALRDCVSSVDNEPGFPTTDGTTDSSTGYWILLW